MLISELTKKLIGSSKHVSVGLFILEFHKIMNGWITFVGEFLILVLSHLYSSHIPPRRLFQHSACLPVFWNMSEDEGPTIQLLIHVALFGGPQPLVPSSGMPMLNNLHDSPLALSSLLFSGVELGLSIDLKTFLLSHCLYISEKPCVLQKSCSENKGKKG